VVIEGKVRVRDEAVQLNCDRARRYVPSVQTEEGHAPPDVEPSDLAADEYDAGTVMGGPQSPLTTLSSRQEAVPAAPARKRRLVISLGETENAEEDILRLHKVVDTLKQYNGGDEVSLLLGSNGSSILAKLPVCTSYCPELQERLAGLLGNNAVSVEELKV